MKKINIVLAVVLISIGIGAFIIIGNSGSISDKKVIPANDISDIRVEMFEGSIRVVPDQDAKEIKVELDGEIYSLINENRPNLSLNQSDHTLTIALNKVEKGVSFGYESLNLTISMPEKVYQSLILETSNGDIHMENLSAEVIQANTEDGTILLKNLNARDLLAKSGHGDITLKTEMNPSLLKIDAKSGYGTVMIFGKSSKDYLQVGEGTNNIVLLTEDGDISVMK